MNSVAAGRAVAATIRRDLAERRGLRWSILLDLGYGVVNLGIFLFFSRVLAGSRFGGSASYFDYAAASITFMVVMQAASVLVVSRTVTEQRAGTLEMLAAQPVPAGMLALGVAGYPFTFALLRAGAYLVVLAGVLHLHVADWRGVVLVLVAGGAAMAGVGVGLMAFTVALGYGDAVARLVLVALSFLSGTYFPVGTLPGALHPVCAVLPSRLALDGLRAAMSGREWTGDVLGLVGLAVVLLPVSTWLFGGALRLAVRRGTLTRG